MKVFPERTVATLNDGNTAIVVDDHCYVLCNWDGITWASSAWIFHEATAALKALPDNPDHALTIADSTEQRIESHPKETTNVVSTINRIISEGVKHPDEMRDTLLQAKEQLIAMTQKAEEYKSLYDSCIEDWTLFRSMLEAAGMNSYGGLEGEIRECIDQLAACEKERDDLREIAKWREKYNLTGSPEIYDRENVSREFRKWTDGYGKVGADDTATCSWYEGDDGGPWATDCNELFNIENEGPDANGMKFCCFCGKKLVEVCAESEEEDV